MKADLDGKSDSAEQQDVPGSAVEADVDLAVGLAQRDTEVLVKEVPEALIDRTTAEPQTLFGLPMTAFVRGGGTTSSRHDQEVARQAADAEARRNDADAAKERQLARTPLEEGGGVMFGGRLLPSADAEAAVILLVYLSPKGEVRYESGEEFQCLADLTVLEDGELCLVLVCPTCKSRNVPQDQCQLRLRQTNRHFEFSPKGAGELVVFDDGFTKKAYKSAGTIVESERFSCAQCGWAARIVENRVRPDA